MENNHNFLYVIWKDPISRRNYIIGKLTKGNKYTFEYCEEYKNALSAGWKLLSAFPDEKLYESDTLFAAFASRLPDPKRRGIETILQKYGLDKYDGYELLRRSSGRLPIDTYEFIDPIFPDDKTIEKDFYLMGSRHHMACKGEDCSLRTDLITGDEVSLSPDKDNQYDKYAIIVKSKDKTILGYIPRYYSQSVYMRLEKRMTYQCIITELSTDSGCQNCIKVKLTMPKAE